MTDTATPDTATPEGAMISVAVLDDNDVFVGMAKIYATNVHPRYHLPEIASCDLPPGKYKWNRETKTFEHLMPLGVIAADKLLAHPNTLTAIVNGFKAVEKHGVILPPETRALVAAHDQYKAHTPANPNLLSPMKLN